MVSFWLTPPPAADVICEWPLMCSLKFYSLLKFKLPSTNIPDFYANLIPYWILPPYGILPPLLILSIERKQLHDESVYLRKGQHLTLRVLDRHRDQRDQAGRKEGWGETRELVETGFSFSRLVPFLSSDQQQQLGGRSLSTQPTESLLSANLIVAPRRNFFAYSCLPKILGWLRSPSKKWFGADWCVPYAIVPPGLVLSVVWKEVHYKFVDFGQGQHLARRTVDRHVYHGYVAKE